VLENLLFAFARSPVRSVKGMAYRLERSPGLEVDDAVNNQFLRPKIPLPLLIL
jgi:hypothetical protein